MNSTNIPAARDLVTSAIKSLKPFAEAFPEIAETIAQLEQAHGMMTRVVTKTTVRNNVEITEAHRARLAVLAASGAPDRMTIAEIAIDVFGQACNLGRLSAIISGREAEYKVRSKAFFSGKDALTTA